MASHVYLATGLVIGVRVMKIGKTNTPNRRQRQISLEITHLHECANERDAFSLETRMRNFWLKRLARPLEHSQDWFLFNEPLFDAIAAVFDSQRWDSLDLEPPRPSWNDVLESTANTMLSGGSAYSSMLLEVRELQNIVSAKIDAVRNRNNELIRRLAIAEHDLKLYESGRLRPPSSEG